MIFNDSFQQANEDPLSSGGAWALAFSGAPDLPQVVSNRVRVGVVGSFAAAKCTTVNLGLGQFLEFAVPTYNTGNAANIEIGLMLRQQADETHYRCELIKASGASPTYTFYRANSGSFTTLLGPTTFTIAAADRFRFAVVQIDNAAVMRLFENNVVLASFSDSAAPLSSGNTVSFFSTSRRVGRLTILSLTTLCWEISAPSRSITINFRATNYGGRHDPTRHYQ